MYIYICIYTSQRVRRLLGWQLCWGHGHSWFWISFLLSFFLSFLDSCSLVRARSLLFSHSFKFPLAPNWLPLWFVLSSVFWCLSCLPCSTVTRYPTIRVCVCVWVVGWVWVCVCVYVVFVLMYVCVCVCVCVCTRVHVCLCVSKLSRLRLWFGSQTLRLDPLFWQAQRTFDLAIQFPSLWHSVRDEFGRSTSCCLGVQPVVVTAKHPQSQNTTLRVKTPSESKHSRSNTNQIDLIRPFFPKNRLELVK